MEPIKDLSETERSENIYRGDGSVIVENGVIYVCTHFAPYIPTRSADSQLHALSGSKLEDKSE